MAAWSQLLREPRDGHPAWSPGSLCVVGGWYWHLNMPPRFCPTVFIQRTSLRGWPGPGPEPEPDLGWPGVCWRFSQPPSTSSHPSSPCWIQLLPLLLLTPLPVTHASPFSSSEPLLKIPLCQGADRNGEGNSWEVSAKPCLSLPGQHPPSAPGHYYPASFASHNTPKN